MKKNLLYLLSFYLITGCTKPLSSTSYEQLASYKPINQIYMVGSYGAVLRKDPNMFTPVCKNMRGPDTVYVYGSLNHDWYVVRRNGKKYFAPATDIYQYRTLEKEANAYQSVPDSANTRVMHIPLLAE